MIKEIVSASLPVDEKLIIRKNSVCHGSGKKRVCIVTGTHGDELEGQYVCFRLNQILREQPDMLEGEVDIYPALNPLGIDTIQRGIPNFDTDMNRTFPGNSEGSMYEQASHAICEDLKVADMVIDIHSSNIFLREMPQVRINILNADTLVPQAEKLGVDFIWVHDSATVLESTLAYSLNSTGTPCLVVEMGVGMRINHHMGERLTTGILNLLSHMGMWKGKLPDTPMPKPVKSCGDTAKFINAGQSGVFITDVKTGIVVDPGEEIGLVTDPLTGDILQTVTSPVHGLLFTLRAYPVVYEGSLLARIHELGSEE